MSFFFFFFFFFFSSRRRHTRSLCDWSSDVCSSDLLYQPGARRFYAGQRTKFELIPIGIAALEQILAWQIPRIAATLAQTTAEIARQASSLGLDVAPDHERGPHMLGIGLPEHTRARASDALAVAGCYAAFR